MKKISLLALMLFVSVSNLAAEPFKGFYVGASAGTEARGTEYNDKTGGINNQYNKNNVGTLGTIFTGYGIQLPDHHYFGGEFSLIAPFSNKEDRLVDQNSAVPKIKYTRGLGIRLAPRMGQVIAGNTLLYGVLGVGISRDKLTYTNANSIKVLNSTKTVMSFEPGFGFEHNHGKMIYGIEYIYALGKRTIFASPQIKLGAQRKSHQVQFRISYGF